MKYQLKILKTSFKDYASPKRELLRRYKPLGDMIYDCDRRTFRVAKIDIPRNEVIEVSFDRRVAEINQPTAKDLVLEAAVVLREAMNLFANMLKELDKAESEEEKEDGQS